MMIRKTSAVLCLAVALGFWALPGAWAEGRTLSLQEVRDLSLGNSLSLKKLAAQAEAAGLTTESQALAALPSVSAGASGSAKADSSTTLASGLSASADLKASMTFFDGGKNAALTQKYSAAQEAAQASLKEGRLAVIASADTAFFAVLQGEAAAAAAAEDLAAATTRLQLATAKVNAGALSKAEYLQTESEAASYQAALSKAQKSLLSARAKLASLTRGSMTAEPAAVDFGRYDGTLKSLAALDDQGLAGLVAHLVEMAGTHSPGLAGYDLALAQARYALAAAKSAYLPTVSGSATQSLSWSQGGLAPTTSLTVSAAFDLDFWATKNSVSQAELAVKVGELEGLDGRASLELELGQAVYAWVSAALAIPSSTKALEYAQSNYDNVLEKFRLSSATASDLSTAEALVSTSRNALISARYAFLQDLSTLRGLVGLEDEGAILSLL